MRRLLLVVVLLASLFMVHPAQAQTNLVLENLDIGLWPEYDQADVLVIYWITLPADVSLPAQVSIRIPRDSGEPYNLAMKDVDGLLYNLAYTTEVQNDWIKVTFSTPSAEVQLEYYDTGLTKDGAVRNYEYIWPGDYEVKNLSMGIQQPVNATNMQILPDFGAGVLADDGLLYYNKEIGSVSAGTRVTVRFSYNKPDDELSLSSQSVQPVQPASTSEAGRVKASTISPWIIGGLGLLLLAGGLSWFLMTRNQSLASAQAGKRRHRAANRPAAKPGADAGTFVYCSQCGRKAPSTDAFCRSCGNRLRAD